MADTRAELLMIAGRVRETCTDLVLQWGDAVRRARLDPSNAELEEKAREAGKLVGGLGAVLSERLGRKL